MLKFTKTGGRLYCCKDCNDHLNIPVDAITDDDFEVTQKFPFICRKEDFDYRVICVKEYNERDGRNFAVHVKIVTYLTMDISYYYLRVRYSNDYNSYNEVLCLNDTDSNNVPDVYFIVCGNKVTIFTKHFTEYIVELLPHMLTGLPQLSRTDRRTVDLVSSAYISLSNQTSEVIMKVFIWDKLHNKYKLIKGHREKIEFEDKSTSRYFDDAKLINLPKTIRDKSAFKCIVMLSKSSWKFKVTTEKV